MMSNMILYIRGGGEGVYNGHFFHFVMSVNELLTGSVSRMLFSVFPSSSLILSLSLSLLETVDRKWNSLVSGYLL